MLETLQLLWVKIWYALNAPEGGLIVFGCMIVFGLFVMIRYLIRYYIFGIGRIGKVPVSKSKGTVRSDGSVSAAATSNKESGSTTKRRSRRHA
eukprot:gene30312-35302_t